MYIELEMYMYIGFFLRFLGKVRIFNGFSLILSETREKIPQKSLYILYIMFLYMGFFSDVHAIRTSECIGSGAQILGLVG